MINKLVKLAQTFYVNGTFLPKKMSSYIKVSQSQKTSKIDASGTFSLDATNVSKIIKNSNNQNSVVIGYDIVGFSGCGYMQFIDFTQTTNSQLSYYLTGLSVAKVYLWIRIRKIDSSVKIRSSIHNSSVQLEDTVTATGAWFWKKIQIFPQSTSDTQLLLQGVLGNFLLDKIIYTYDQAVDPNVLDIQYSQPSYTTIHSTVYQTDGTYPTNKMMIYSCKSTIQHIYDNKWYSFMLQPIHWSISYSYPNQYYAFVLSSSGNSSRRFVVLQTINGNGNFNTKSLIQH